MKKYMGINTIDDDEDLEYQQKWSRRRKRLKEELKKEFEDVFNDQS
ncbi:MAG: hypothetical protein PHE92_09600 [Candidatus Cloacimonetes bacterium]|nr:hypothetical protein [Candidatus Cloacimonadota bacterium]